MPITSYSNYVCDRCGATVENQTAKPAGWMQLMSMSDSVTTQVAGIFCDVCSAGIADATKKPEEPA